MALDPQQVAALTNRFEDFHKLDHLKDSDARKNAVRLIEREVKDDQLKLSSSQFKQNLTSDYELARILAYLLIENECVNSDHPDRQNYVEAEWERLRRAGMRHDVSRMPLYYAIRAYVSFLRNSSELRMKATGDSAFFLQMDAAIGESQTDQKSILRERVLEVLALLGAQIATQGGTTKQGETTNYPWWVRTLWQLPKWGIGLLLIYVAFLVSYSVFDNRRIDFWPPAIHSREAGGSNLKAQLDDTTWGCSSPKCDPNPQVKPRIWLTVKLQSDHGEIADGQILGENTITYGGLRGTISKDLRTISWDNDTIWTRK